MTLRIALAGLFGLLATALAAQPNFIFILADDMGYGDVSHAGGKAATPHLDKLREQGMRFTDAHTTSSVCTPTRYSILTGRYNWRSRLKQHVLFGYSEPLIEPERQTVGGFLQTQGYHTGCVGKWHLGIGWPKLANGEVRVPEKSFLKPRKGKKPRKPSKAGWDIDYAKPVRGPLLNGFDNYWGISASLDMPPYVYIKDDRPTVIPTAQKAFMRPGPAGMEFDAMNCLEDFAREARAYVKKQAQDKSKPFFLYLPLTSPHTPIVPSPKWQGKSELGRYGDFLMETDWVVGEVMAELEAQGIADNTLLLFTADNGCSPAARIPDLVKKGHQPNGDWRGHKADIYEGGHRVPFLVRWPGKVKAGSTCDSTVSTVDFFRTVADVVKAEDKIDAKAAGDSYSFLPDLLGDGKTARPTTIHHSINGSFAIRKGKWKLNLCPGSGGWSQPKPNKSSWEAESIVQLFDLEADPAEQNNLQAKHPELVNELVAQLAKEVKAGRSTPGPDLENDGAIPFNAKLLTTFPVLKN